MATQDMRQNNMVGAYAWNTRKKHLQKMGKHGYRCCLCDTGKFHMNSAHSHFHGHQHRVKVSDALKTSNRSIVDIRKLRSRVSGLGLAQWRNHMQELLLQHVLTRWDWKTSKPCDTQICAIPTTILSRLENYEKMETESLLELVAWKVNCLVGSGHFDSMQEIVDQWALVENFDHVEYKRQRRLSGNVGIILVGVLAFLW